MLLKCQGRRAKRAVGRRRSPGHRLINGTFNVCGRNPGKEGLKKSAMLSHLPDHSHRQKQQRQPFFSLLGQDFVLSDSTKNPENVVSALLILSELLKSKGNNLTPN